MTKAARFSPPEKDFLERRSPEDIETIRPKTFERSIKKYVNLWEDGRVTSPRNQIPCNACTSFGLAASLEARHLSETGESVELATGWMHRCIMNASCKRGLSLSAVVRKMSGRFIPYADQGFYPWEKDNCDIEGEIEFRDVRKFDFDLLMHDALTQGVVVAVGMNIDTEFEWWMGGGPYSLTPGKRRYQHVAALIGYDDNERIWFLKNSLGDGWGDGGFFTVRYGECGIGTEYGGFGAVPWDFVRGRGSASGLDIA